MKTKFSIPLLPIFVVLTILKLAGVISWSWFWISAIIWMPVAFVLFMMMVGALAIVFGGAKLK